MRSVLIQVDPDRAWAMRSKGYVLGGRGANLVTKTHCL